MYEVVVGHLSNFLIYRSKKLGKPEKLKNYIVPEIFCVSKLHIIFIKRNFQFIDR